MFVSKKRTVLLLLLVCLASVWVIVQNVTLNKSLFRWSGARRQLIEMSRTQAIRDRKEPAKKGRKSGFSFDPPPALENEERSEGYAAEDLYFRRWQVAHNVDPVRPRRGGLGIDPKRRGWADHGEKGMYEALKRRQEERRRQVEEIERRRNKQMMNRSEEEESEADPADDGRGADDMSSSYIVQRRWLRARLEDFCNQQGVMDGVEGDIPTGHRLVSVHLLTRHGDRTPQQNAKTGQLAPFKWECSLPEANKKIGSIHLEKFLRLVRAGLKDTSSLQGELRRVAESIPMKDWSSPCYDAQLTPQGWVQFMRLGDLMRKRYWHLLGLGSAKSQRGIAVKSTSSHRTMQSAMSFLFGFLPNFTLQDLALIKMSQSATFCSEQHCVCAAVERLRQTIGRQYTEEHKRANVSSLCEQASRLMYIRDPLYSIPNPSRLVELLTARACHKSSLPCTDNGCLSELAFEKVFQAVDTIFASIRRGANSSAELYGRLAMHPLLTSIATTMKYLAGAKVVNMPRFYLYSGHDISVTPMLDALGLQYPWPGYGSRVVFEQWRPTAGDEQAVRILYNGDDVTGRVSFCRDRILENGLCPFSAFYRFVNDENLRVFGADTFEEACAWGLEK